MSKLIIEGKHKLSGAMNIHGAKNSALPVLAATILANGISEIHNCPQLSDVAASVRILRHLGCNVSRSENCVTVDSLGLCRSDIPDTLMREMRSSIVFLGAIAARTGEAHLTFPGGCELGTRPIDLHLSALRQLGMEILEDGGRLECSVKARMKGATIALAFPSVGATENIILASVTAEGTTSILNAAREPEIVDLCNYLNKCGARITGAGESAITIEGVDSLYGCAHSVIPDRIETVTYMAAAAITGSTLTLKSVNPQHVATVLPVFREAGCAVFPSKGEIKISAPGRLNRVHSVRTMPYPGFPTDAQAPVMAMITVADGTSVFIENIFESRYKHAGELMRLGAKIKIEGRVAVVEGVKRLSGTQVECTDLRGGAALVIAGLAADGVTEVTHIHHIDRGYEKLKENLCGIGAVVKRV
ncbi:MAG TPA: UDP-N-acetylglucosamine 1-carboxyvinyltransferase [Candidatus Avimonas sp.]|jgi:UDP-N-acetylglucosamine 1-carboxyvinyltransferase|nr:UDP-N-acetylglucosamine 1-carboxyvinyltransferase [Clostridiales bacterium]HOB36808.1 UDP-N-acetylglucosamine 1-carboxyvinyltransferase [Candidatus Avimonas sp.]HQA15899.1 UDP-N-acetylglucosamine 1-carboxyvinyltransferase [Candidatus Avimonas sp.]HQD37980.1 UDP-N-acetylglucosamine 1-carboxyvinyltransferase [Candidatus Avimonas sp.]